MGEDVSSQIRTGVTVIVVAALISMVLNLMAVGQNITSGGLATLESGADQVSAQEYEKYNQKKFSGTSVKAAVSLYQSKDMCIVIRTKECSAPGSTAWAYMYGSLLRSVSGTEPTAATDPDGNKYYYIPSANSIITQKAGEASYTAELWTTSGIINICNNTRGFTRSGDPQTVLDSARFRSFLIKNVAGKVIGIYFEQIA